MMLSQCLGDFPKRLALYQKLMNPSLAPAARPRIWDKHKAFAERFFLILSFSKCAGTADKDDEAEAIWCVGRRCCTRSNIVWIEDVTVDTLHIVLRLRHLLLENVLDRRTICDSVSIEENCGYGFPALDGEGLYVEGGDGRASSFKCAII